MQQHRLSAGSQGLEEDRRSPTDELLVICSQAGGNQREVFDPGPCPETGPDKQLVGEAGGTPWQH